MVCNIYIKCNRFVTSQLTYKSRRIVISNSFSVSVRLQNGIGLNNPIFQICLLLSTISFLFISSKDGKIGDDFLGVLRFSCTWLTTKNKNWCKINGKQNNRLISTPLNGKNMKWPKWWNKGNHLTTTNNNNLYDWKGNLFSFV